MIIYAEYVFIENFIMNFIILLLTGKFSKYPINKTKLLISASISALYAFIIFFPSLHFLFSIIMKISCSMLIIIFGFTPYKFKDFFKLLGMFYLITLVFGGAAFAIFYFTNFNGIISNGIFYIGDISIKNIFLASGLAYILINFCWVYIQKQFSKEKILMEFKIVLNETDVKITGIVDTGNSLVDPISQYPVIIVEYEAISEILPSEVQEIFKTLDSTNLIQVPLLSNNSSWISRFRVIPYNSLGKENGLLLGFKPDGVHIDDENIKNIIIAIYNKKLSKAGEYNALLHPDLI